MHQEAHKIDKNRMVEMSGKAQLLLRFSFCKGGIPIISTEPFFKIPFSLMTDARYSSLSNDAKLLYGVLLDRAKLSDRSGWRDKHGCYVYYTIEHIQQMFHCCGNTAMKWTRELEEVGLLQRVKQGQGRPTKLYVYPADTEIKTSDFQNS